MNRSRAARWRGADDQAIAAIGSLPANTRYFVLLRQGCVTVFEGGG
jgi:hypothetical protein